MSRSIFCEISKLSWLARSSVAFSASTITRSSRPAWMAKHFSTPSKLSLHADDRVRLFKFFRPDFPDVMKQAGPFCLLGVQPEFTCHDGAEVGNLT